MRTGNTPNLPIAPPRFDPVDEQLMRRTAEQYLQSLRTDVVTIRDQKDRQSTLALRRFQFLLMGA